MSERNGSSPGNSTHSPQAAPNIRLYTNNDLDAYDTPPPNTPPPPYSPAPPPYIPCTCSAHESRATIEHLGFDPQLSHEIWDRWQLHRLQFPATYQGVQPLVTLYFFLSFVFQCTQLPFAFPRYEPRYRNREMCRYLDMWGLSNVGYWAGEWNEAHRRARCADAAAKWIILILSLSCLGHAHPRYILTDMDRRRRLDLSRMTTAARSVI